MQFLLIGAILSSLYVFGITWSGILLAILMCGILLTDLGAVLGLLTRR